MASAMIDSATQTGAEFIPAGIQLDGEVQDFAEPCPSPRDSDERKQTWTQTGGPWVTHEFLEHLSNRDEALSKLENSAQYHNKTNGGDEETAIGVAVHQGVVHLEPNDNQGAGADLPQPPQDEAIAHPRAQGTVVNGKFHCVCGGKMKNAKHNITSHFSSSPNHNPNSKRAQNSVMKDRVCGKCNVTIGNFGRFINHIRQTHDHTGPTEAFREKWYAANDGDIIPFPE
ncbi:hypothetical protein M426DRAFT_20475 [Hypoxylon sp. CI-4A]|nr:hypothetical protein M426DRAFT_20475 [Hypoxylon sp. CI-4A]